MKHVGLETMANITSQNISMIPGMCQFLLNLDLGRRIEIAVLKAESGPFPTNKPKLYVDDGWWWLMMVDDGWWWLMMVDDDDGIQGYLATWPGNRQRMARQYRQNIVPLTIPNGVYTQLRRVCACVGVCVCVPLSKGSSWSAAFWWQLSKSWGRSNYLEHPLVCPNCTWISNKTLTPSSTSTLSLSTYI